MTCVQDSVAADRLPCLSPHCARSVGAQEAPWLVERDLGGPSAARQLWEEEKAEPPVASQMSSTGKPVARSGHANDAFSEQCEGRG
ncbi:hypothetical protein NDU88_005254 [Pleurodeles waltl]|uniref:Uncharacterized protein n=1 Tax=Pleurodeles waltl TaxID=8319 RepID=A0AAV7SLA3_PLEWA|nr:hypothetical protein NDU88_005254 [Pleurodeles waltl]